MGIDTRTKLKNLIAEGKNVIVSQIAGHVFCSFLALVLGKELDQRPTSAGQRFELLCIKQDLEALTQVVIEENGKMFAVRSEGKGNCGKLFQAVGVALPSTIRAAE